MTATAAVQPARAGLDIYRSAKQVIDRFGDEGAIEAALRADAMLDRGETAAERPSKDRHA